MGTQIGVRLAALTGTATGGAPILSYHLELDASGGGNGPWTEVAAGGSADPLALERIVGGLTPGKLYFFRYRARNVHGWSGALPEHYSPVKPILLATVPSATTAVTTTNQGADVIVSWALPPSDGASAILGYRILLKGADALFREEPTRCGGLDPAQQAAILAARACTISMAALT